MLSAVDGVLLFIAIDIDNLPSTVDGDGVLVNYLLPEV